MKKNKLYTVNRWNQPAFMSANRFDWGGLALADKKANPWDYADDLDFTEQYKNQKNWLGLSKKNNPFSKGNLNGTMGGLASAGAGLVGSTLNSAISGGYDSSVGKGISTVGSTVGKVVGTVNPLLGAAVDISSQVLGGGINALIGTKVDQAALERANAGTTYLNNFNSDARTFDAIKGPEAQSAVEDVYSGGVFKKGWAAAKNAELRRQREAAKSFALRSVDNNINNLIDDQMNNALANFSAFGGPLDQYDGSTMGAVDYGFMSDYLTQRKRENDMKSKTGGITPMPAFMPNSYAIGGDIDESAASQLARGWYDSTIGGFVNMGKAIGKEVGKLFSSDEGNFGGGSYSGAGRTSRWKPAYKPKNKDNFNKAFDEARNAGAETFMFGDKEYSTTKEANPIREFNNRHVGAGRTEDMIRQRGTYGRDFGPITGRYSLLPVIPYALGGDLQTNGGDFSTGLTHIDAGLSHEENPNEGVQMGVDNEGIPNLVEEGEVIFNDYVFSNRIPCDFNTKKVFHIGKKQEITYAALAKRLEKEFAERPNDPISKAGFEKQMQMLEEQQERQKQEMEAERAKAAFEALTPEEQTALMQQRAEQEAMAQQAAGQEAMVDTGMAFQPTEEAMAQQQQQMTDGSEAALGQEPEMNCFGGKINRFDKGGVLKLLNSLGYKTVAEAERAGWKPSDFGDYRAWTDIDSNSKLSDNFVWTDEFSKRLTTPEQKAALALGWTPTAALLGRKWYEGDNGNSVGWTQSVGKNALNAKEFKDYAKRYKNTLGWAVDKGIIKAPEGNATVSMADIAKAMREAPAWKTTDNWLYSDIANQASYLGMARGLNPDDDTKFTDRWSPYGSFSKDADGNWSYTLKSDLTDAQKKAFTDQFRRARTDNQIGVMYNNFQDPTSVTNRYVLDEAGNPVLLTTDDLTGYEQLGSYTWGNPDANKNNTAILYKSKNSAAAKSAEEPAGEKQPEKKIVPDLRTETSFGLLGPAVGLGLMGLGVGKPDTGSYDAAISGAGNYTTADWMPRGDFLTYRPTDPWRWINPILANSRATDRAIVNNSGGNRGTAMAGLLANGYNTTIGLGEAGLKGEDANFDRGLKIAAHNADVHKSNQGEYGVTSRFNASAYNDANRASAQMKLNVAQAKDDANRWWASNLYGNINSLFDNINQWEKWKRDHNTVAKMYANSLAGTVSENTPVAVDFVKNASNGGKLKKKKRGLTI